MRIGRAPEPQRAVACTEEADAFPIVFILLLFCPDGALGVWKGKQLCFVCRETLAIALCLLQCCAAPPYRSVGPIMQACECVVRKCRRGHERRPCLLRLRGGGAIRAPGSRGVRGPRAAGTEETLPAAGHAAVCAVPGAQPQPYGPSRGSPDRIAGDGQGEGPALRCRFSDTHWVRADVWVQHILQEPGQTCECPGAQSHARYYNTAGR